MLTKKQRILDNNKWFDSEKAGKDLCGTYEFCKLCDKSVENPCHKAFKKYDFNPTDKKRAFKRVK